MKEFVPERWLGRGKHVAGQMGGSMMGGQAKEITWYQHFLTFFNGPRMCLGKGFALAEFKVYL